MRLFKLAVVHQDWKRKLGRLMYTVKVADHGGDLFIEFKSSSKLFSRKTRWDDKILLLFSHCKIINEANEPDVFLSFFFFSCLNTRLPLWADLVLLQLYIFLFKGMLEPRACVQICHSSQDQLWKLEVRRLLQWASNGGIMQCRSSGCPHYLAVVVMNGLKCTLSKSEEKCDPSAKIQMVPLQGRCSRSPYILFIMQLMFR